MVAPILLLWATLGILIFYQAYRYNIIFVSETEIDTHGLIYPRALKQLFAGLYMAEVCLIGLFAVSKALGQLALIIILLVFTILYHISLNRALDPLLYNLPRTLYVDEQRHQAHVSSYEDASATEDGLGVQPVLAVQESIETKKTLSWGIGGKLQPNGNFISRFIKPWVYADYWTLRQLVPSEDSNVAHPPEVAEGFNPYWPSSVTKTPPLLWIPRDPAGVSKLEITETSKIIPITDEGCILDEENRLVWDTVKARPPIWEAKVLY